MGTGGALQNISGAVEGPSLASLKTAHQVAEQVRLSVTRIRELAEAKLLPHFRVDGGEPLFCPTMLKRYVRQHLTVLCEGAPLPLNLRPIVFRPISHPIPAALAAVQDRLCDCPAIDIPPCVYFLIDAGAVVYIGQSRHLPSRLAQHNQNGKRWERVLFMPVPESELLRVEAQWIAALQPPLNKTSLSKGSEEEGHQLHRL